MDEIVKLKKIFNNYLEIAIENLYKTENEIDDRKLILFRNPIQKLNELINIIENKDLFEDLINITRNIFVQDLFEGKEDFDGDPADLYDDWKDFVKNYFRRSGLYLKCYYREKIIIDDAFNNYITSFKIKSPIITFLAPINFVDFSVNEIRFDNFIIKKYSKEQLIFIVNNDINRFFYPKATWNIDILSSYWFLVETKEIEKSALLQSDSYYNYLNNKRNNLDCFDCIKDSIFKLGLYDWNKERTKGIQDVNVSIIAQADNYFLAYPGNSPNIELLSLKQKYDEDGKLIGQEPYFIFSLEQDINIFNNFIHEIDFSFDQIFNKWPFLKIALEYFIKGLFEDDYMRASENLLWNITAIEALMGERQDLKKILGTRIGAILGNDYDERNTYRNKFRKIYDVRSDLVHGRIIDKEILLNDITDARNISRKACLWFIKLCINIIKKYDYKINIKREDILAYIDFLYYLREKGVESLFELNPKGFPCYE